MTNRNDSSNCLNCGAPLEGKYCKECGQSSRVGRITVMETLESFLSSAFSIEGKYFHTLFTFFRNPGKVVRGFIEGKRNTYYKPVAFFILNTAIYLIVRSLLDYDPLEGQQAMKDSDVPVNMQKIRNGSRFMVQNINNILFLLVFSIAINLKLFFRKRYNFAEYATLGFYVSATYILMGLITMFTSFFFGFDLKQFQIIVLAILIFYTLVSFFQDNSIGNILKYLLVCILSLIFYVFFGFSLSYLIVNYF